MTAPDASTRDGIIPALEEIYARIKKVSRDLRPSDRIVRDLEIDSLATLEILLALEERFGVTLIDNPRLARIETVGDLAALVDDARREATP